MTRAGNCSWENRPLRELLRLSAPIVVSTLSLSSMTVVDTLFVAQLGEGALGGVGLGGVIFFTAVCFTIGLLRGVKVAVAQSVGAGDDCRAQIYIRAGIRIALIAGLLTTLASLLVTPGIAWLTSDPEVGGLAMAYFQIRVLAAIPRFIAVAMREGRWGLGDTRAPMHAAVCANVANIVLDYLLIFVVGLGVEGAAWASVCASLIEAVWLLRHYPRGTRPSGAGGLPGIRAASRRVLSIGMPTGAQFFLEVGSFSIMTAMIATMAKAEMGAHQVVLQLTHFSFLPCWAIAEAASVLVGQAVGARRDDLVLVVARQALWIATLYTALWATIFALGGGTIMEFFPGSGRMHEVGATLFYIAALFQIADGINVVARSVLRGTGDVRVPAIIGIVVAWGCTPPLTWLFGLHLEWGASGAWLALCGELCVAAAILGWRLVAGHWRGASAHARDMIVD